MKRNLLTMVIGGLLLLVFVTLLFLFQVRQTEIALVTTFGKPTRSINTDATKPEPGLYCKWPWPIQKVQKFDKRIQNFEQGKFEETLTQDGKNILIMVYGGWSISDPKTFRERFNDSVQRAQIDLEGLIRSAKNAAVGQHPFSHFISTNEKELKFDQIEDEILKSVQSTAAANYGVNVVFLRIKKLGLPESITQKVFDRMKEERNRYVQKLQADGEREATIIKSGADKERADILSKADAEATRIRGEAEAEAAKYYEVFEKNPELAILLLKLNALEQSLKDHSTLILDQRTPPFDLLNGGKQPAANAAKK